MVSYSRENRAMQKPPAQKRQQDNYLKTALRLPPELKADLAEAAARAGHSVNAEILARCQATPLYEQLKALSAENAELKIMLREILANITSK